MADTVPPHLVLARKWRPERLSELVGQEHVTRTLTEALKRGRIAHAFLFTGIRGVGKTTAARILARCLNCEKGPAPEACGECPACVEIRAGRALDVSEIDGATYRKIDDARAIIENLSYRPARDRFKIYIIDEAHQLTDQAFNALLKTLEEPPPHVKFILATTEPQKMPETILSRLQRYDFRRIPLTTIFTRLKELARREGIGAEDSALLLLAREAGGSMRDAERMLETALASATGQEVTEAEVAASLGVASRSAIYRLSEALLGKDAAGALRHVRELYARGANLESLGRDLLDALRNLAVAKLATQGSPGAHADLPDHEAEELGRLAAGVSGRDVMRLFRLMAQAQEEIMRSPYPDLLMEMAVIRMATLAPVLDADELMRAFRQGAPPASAAPGGSAQGGSAHGGLGEPGTARRIRVEGEVKADAPVRAQAPVSAGLPDLPELREHLRARRPALAGFMEQGAVLSLDGDLLNVSARSDIYIRYLSDNRALIAELAAEFYGRPIRVGIVSNGGMARTAGRRPDAPMADGNGHRSTSRGVAEEGGAKAQSPRALAGALALDNVSAVSSPTPQTPVPRSGTPAERQALLSDPEVRRIFEALEARLVEVRVKPGGGDIARRPSEKS